MNRRAAIRNLMVAGAGLLAPRFPAAMRQAQQDYTIRSEVRLVLLDVSVKDSKGGLVAGLSKDNFQVFENGVLQPITVFANYDLPVNVGILVDESRSMTPRRAEVLSAAEIFLEESNPRDEVFVLNFNDRVKRGLPDGLLFSGNREQLRAALYRGHPDGKTALYDAILDGLRQLELGRRDKKALVVISDGGDTASRHTRRETFDAVERSIATVYTVGLFADDDPDRDPAMLKRLARLSGGEAFFPAGASDLVAACRGTAQEIRTRYSIGYVPAAGNGDPERRIRVHVRVRGLAGLTARTRTRYRYDEPNPDR